MNSQTSSQINTTSSFADKKTAIVIGSGFGGLTLAVRLQASGIQTTLIEKRDKPGGRAYVFKDAGFTFDAGPTVITAPEALSEVFEVAGKKMDDYVELVPVTPFYRLSWDDGYEFDYSNDEEKLKEQILKKNPSDWEGYKAFLAYSKEVFHQGYTKLAHVPFLKFWDMMRTAPQLIKLSAQRSVYSIVSKFVQDKHLRQAFSFHSLLVGGNPFKTSSIYTLIHYLERNWGVFWVKGGTNQLVNAYLKVFKELGGQLLLNSEVEEIRIENGVAKGVQIKNGEFVAADMVCSNADVAFTYDKLLKKSTKANKGRRKALNSSFSMSLVVIYFGTKKKYPGQAHHQVIFGPRYKELLKDIFDNGILADDFSLYLHAPSVTDQSVAPEGHEAFYVLSPVPHLGKLNIDWEKTGPEYANRIINYLDEKYLPGLKENLVTLRVFTPLDFKQELLAHYGSAFSIEPILTQSAWFRTHNRDPEIKNLYFVGAGTHPGAGVPGVVGSAKATANLILEDFKIMPKVNNSYREVKKENPISQQERKNGTRPLEL